MRIMDRYMVYSTGLALTVLLFFVLSVAVPVFSAQSDTFVAQVTIGNDGPSVTSVTVTDSDADDNIQLSAGGVVEVVCYGAVTDPNGYGDMDTVVGKIFHSTSTVGAGDDYNVHYTNSSCLTENGTSTTLDYACYFDVRYNALNGTWTCNVSVNDSVNVINTSTDTVTLDELVAMTVVNGTLNFGTMNPGEISSAMGSNVTNEGNVIIDVDVKGNADLGCDQTGSIPIANLKYDLASGTAYGSMTSLSTSNVTISGFNLDVAGTGAFASLDIAHQDIYWKLNISEGVLGTCNNTVTVSALKSA